MPIALWITVCLTCLCLVACEDDGADDTEETDAGNGTETLPEGTPRWSEIHYEFAKGCTIIGCHSTSNGPAKAGLAFSVSKDGYAKLLGPSKKCDGLLVDTENPDDSVLLKRIIGKTEACGPRMFYLFSPAVGPMTRQQPVAPELVERVRLWIEAGAPNDLPDLTGVVDAAEATGPTFTEVYDRVLKPSCGGLYCHAPWQSPDEMRLSVANKEDAYYDQINVPGLCQGHGAKNLRVKPGDPDGSQLVRKLENRSCPGGMPVDWLTYAYRPLDQELIDLVRDWISAGAANN